MKVVAASPQRPASRDSAKIAKATRHALDRFFYPIVLGSGQVSSGTLQRICDPGACQFVHRTRMKVKWQCEKWSGRS